MKNEKVEHGKNGLRNYSFNTVQKNKIIYHGNNCTQNISGMFYKKNCLFCKKEFEARRVDTSFCCQGCQKAHLRLRKNNLIIIVTRRKGAV